MADARKIMDNLAVASENARLISGDAKNVSDKLNNLMAGGSLSVSGELLYNTKREDFSPNVSLRIGRDSPLILGVESFGNDSVYNVQYGQKKGKFDIRGGIIRNKLGIGASYKKDKWKFDADLFDPNDLTVRLRGAYEAYPGIYAVGQSIFPHGRHGGGEYIGLGYAY